MSEELKSETPSPSETPEKRAYNKRSLEERRAAALEELRKVEFAEAEEKALEIPEVAEIKALRDTAKKAETQAKQVFSGPNSIANRLEIKKLWILEIQALAAMAKFDSEFASKEVEHYENAMQEIVKANSEEELSSEELAIMVSDAKENAPQSDEADKLRKAYEDAKQARKEFSKAIRTPKNPRKKDSEENEDSEENTEEE